MSREDEIRSRVDAATEGPWTDEDGVLLGADGETFLSCCNLNERTLSFVANSRSDVPYLLDTVDALRLREARLREALISNAARQFISDQTYCWCDEMVADPATHEHRSWCQEARAALTSSDGAVVGEGT